MTTINYRKAEVDGVKVFYREAGNVDAPTLLLHGFPSASHMLIWIEVMLRPLDPAAGWPR
jgi:pimeloyl-ACP methyl ester carboxylesterase